MINVAILTGRLTKDIDLKYTQGGIAFANFTLAVNNTFQNAQGKTDTAFVPMVVFRKQAENLSKYMSKGSLIGVEGRIQTRTYEGKDGKTVYVTEVVANSIQFLESKKTVANKEQPSYAPPERNDDPFNDHSGPIEVTDDDLPF